MKDPSHTQPTGTREASRRLLDGFCSAPLLSGLGTSRLEIASLDHAEHALQGAQATLVAQTARASPTHALPILFDAVGRCYYDNELRNAVPASVGPALKVAIAAVWPQIWEARQRSDSEDDLKALVAAAQVVDQLHLVRSAIVGFGALGTARLDADGVHAEGGIHDALQSMKLAFWPKGQILRLAEETTRTVQLNPAPVLRGVLGALRGEEPCNIEELRDTWLSHVPRRESSKFWEGLGLRLVMWIFIASICERADPILPVVFPPSGIFVESDKERELLQLSGSQLFWTKDWYGKQPPNRHRNLLGDRPLLRIASEPERFCTSLPLVGDSINWFVESSVMHYPGASGIPLSPECFRAIISLPFEARVQSVLASAGFRAGRVNEKGTWFPQNERPVNVSVHAKTSIPGEIDVLAVHPDGWIVVCECKVLAIPWDDRRMRNVLGKLGEEDGEEIRSKVIRKLAWIRAVESHLVSCRIRDRAAIIVLDRPWPGIGISDEVSIVDIAMLGESLARLAAR